MTDIRDELPRYEILSVDGRTQCAILRRKPNGMLEEYMPNVGSAENANFILQSLKSRDESRKVAAANREHDFQESLKKPHQFMQASTRAAICYCGKPTGDPIHIPDPEEEK